MKKLKMMVGLLAAALVSGPATTQMALDSGPAPGDQNVREAAVKPGDTFAVELIAVGGADGMIGFKADLKFDTSQIQFQGFNAGGLFAGAMSMPPKSGPSGVEVNAALMGGGGATGDGGSLGVLTFKAEPTFAGTSIEIVSASFGSTAGIQKVGGAGNLKVFNPDAPPQHSPGPAQGQSGFQNPPGGQPGFQNPPSQSGFQNPPPGGSPTGFQNPQGSGGPGHGGPAMGGPGHGGPGHGGPEMGGPGHGGPGHGGPGMGGPGHGGPGMGGPGMDHDMNPEDVIAQLPSALQPAFSKTMEVERASERAHVEAELKMLRSVRGTLEKTKLFVSTASPEDQERVVKALMYFHHQDERGHGPMGGPGMGGPGMGGPGGPGMGAPGDAGDVVREMIEEVEREIQHLEQELQEL